MIYYTNLLYQKLSKPFIKEFNSSRYQDNWLYKTTKFKKDQIVNSGLYDCKANYFYAYKGVKENGYPWFNFQYKYEVGNTYESTADHTNSEASFGLHAWTQNGATYYLCDKMLKVRIYYKDVARLTEDGSVRVTKLTVVK
jgi:hypothetical protein